MRRTHRGSVERVYDNFNTKNFNNLEVTTSPGSFLQKDFVDNRFEKR